MHPLTMYLSVSADEKPMQERYRCGYPAEQHAKNDRSYQMPHDRIIFGYDAEYLGLEILHALDADKHINDKKYNCHFYPSDH